QKVIARGDALPEFDLHCPLMSLPLAFGTTLETIPAEVPYIAAPPDRVAAWRTKLGPAGGPRIGLVWSGQPKHGNDRNRSMALHLLAPLLETDVEFIGLQQAVRDEDQPVLAAHPRLRQIGSDLHDFADTAAVISQLDRVISIDTGPAHLAGAMGKPVWV